MPKALVPTIKYLILALIMILSCQNVYGESYSNELLNKAESGDVQSQYLLGDCYEKGNGITKNLPAAISWYEKSSEFPLSQVSLAMIYYKGDDIPKDYAKAKYWFSKFEENYGQELPSTLLLNIGNMYYSGGNGIEPDWAMAEQYYTRAKKLSINELIALSQMYTYGGNGLAMDLDKAKNICEILMKNPQSYVAYTGKYTNAIVLYRMNNSEAIFELMNLAKDEQLSPMFRGTCYRLLSSAYRFNRCGVSQDIKKADELFKLANDFGYDKKIEDL